MNRKDFILQMRQVLIRRRDALRRALTGDLAILKELRSQPQSPGDMIDGALDCVHDEISSQLAEVEAKELTKIEYALQRIDEDQYGICEGCGSNISKARLNALPYATRCIKCQSAVERLGRTQFSDVDWSRVLDQPDDRDPSINDIGLDID